MGSFPETYNDPKTLGSLIEGCSLFNNLKNS